MLGVMAFLGDDIFGTLKGGVVGVLEQHTAALLFDRRGNKSQEVGRGCALTERALLLAATFCSSSKKGCQAHVQS